ncbi:SEC-C domain-containing protein [Viridibacillus sp. YIM B01967]|uniref:SEC-C domain-containing protein n=1 Tax=Viridibacillus soli TaxID=2798301 RepID=A0ABS1H6K0_9BACL|nr:SEC-C metal-binding domain-containing protein [Viridibacillus soli]MBK3494658.1 SEC-C domain-containing protein [Viridibacillus soli]
MPGRNDPCPCGSGKKYKKCCEKKEAVTVETVYAEELERVLQTFYDKYPLRSDYASYGEVAEKWQAAVQQYLVPDMIEAIAMDAFFFHERTDVWQGYLQKVKKEIVRPSTLAVLNTWEHPTMMVAEVTVIEENYMMVRNILTDEELHLRRESDKPVPVGVHVFCFILPDGSNKEGHVLAVSSMIFFPKDHQAVFGKLAATFKAQSTLDEEAYWKENSMSFWKELGQAGFEGGEFTDFEADVFLRVLEFLEDKGQDPRRVLEIVEDYVVERQPKARKAVAIAAGAIRFGEEQKLFEPLSMTVKEIAENFEVSTSSLNKYYNELTAYYTEKNI